MAIGSVHNMVSRILMFPFVLFIWRGTFSPVHVTPLLGPPPQNPKTTLPAAAGFGTPHDLLHMAHESLPKERTMMQPKKKLASYSYFQPWDGMEGSQNIPQPNHMFYEAFYPAYICILLQ